jgi:ATP-dependent DNA helicase RecQ
MTAARDLARHKTNAVGQYLSGTRCRQVLLLTYFDEADPARCGVCDICLADKKAAQATAQAPSLREPLLAHLRQAAASPRELLAAFPPQQAAAVTAAVREMVDRGELTYAADGRLQVPR